MKICKMWVGIIKQDEKNSKWGKKGGGWCRVHGTFWPYMGKIGWVKIIDRGMRSKSLVYAKLYAKIIATPANQNLQKCK